MAWDASKDIEPEVLAGRKIIGAAVRRARLRHALSQRQLGSYVFLDQTTISKLENGKLKGIRFSMLCRVIGTVSRAGAFELPDVPMRSIRRLPGESDALLPADELAPSAEGRSYDVDGHGPGDAEDHPEFGSYEAAPPIHAIG